MALRQIKARSLGRLELLAWVNEFLEMDYSKIEHLADGIAFCQIFDACYTKAFALHKLNFAPQGNRAECVKNLMVLVRGLAAAKVKKEVPVERLADGGWHAKFDGVSSSGECQRFEIK